MKPGTLIQATGNTLLGLEFYRVNKFDNKNNTIEIATLNFALHEVKIGEYFLYLGEMNGVYGKEEKYVGRFCVFLAKDGVTKFCERRVTFEKYMDKLWKIVETK